MPFQKPRPNAYLDSNGGQVCVAAFYAANYAANFHAALE